MSAQVSAQRDGPPTVTVIKGYTQSSCCDHLAWPPYHGLSDSLASAEKVQHWKDPNQSIDIVICPRYIRRAPSNYVIVIYPDLRTWAYILLELCYLPNPLLACRSLLLALDYMPQVWSGFVSYTKYMYVFHLNSYTWLLNNVSPEGLAPFQLWSCNRRITDSYSFHVLNCNKVVEWVPSQVLKWFSSERWYHTYLSRYLNIHSWIYILHNGLNHRYGTFDLINLRSRPFPPYFFLAYR